MLVGIVLRGSAFVFRAYSYGPRWSSGGGGSCSPSRVSSRRSCSACVSARWSREASGSALANIGSGPAAVLPSALDAAPADTARASFAAIYVAPWLSPFTLAVGAMTLALFSFLAATYLTIEADGEPELQDDFRRRALGAAGASAVTALIALALGASHGGVMARLVGVGWTCRCSSRPSSCGVVAVVALVRRRYPARAPRGRRVGDADPLGVGARAVPADHPADPNDRRRGRAGDRRCATRSWCSRAARSS